MSSVVWCRPQRASQTVDFLDQDEWAQWYQEKIEKPEGLLRRHSNKEKDFGFDPRLYNWQKRVEVEDEE